MTEYSTKVPAAKALLGCQIWLEPTDTRERIDALVVEARDAGLGWLRIFLMWPWIEPQPGIWDFRIFDDLFDAAHRHGLLVKVTLTANSGPWHVGSPSILHAHNGFLSEDSLSRVEEYIRRSVERYRRHPALGQWILWNEPTSGGDRTEPALAHWRSFLSQSFGGDLGRLNQRWRTGYQSFEEIPFPEAVPANNPHTERWMVHTTSPWMSFGPWLSDWKGRARWLNFQLLWVQNQVRVLDPITPTSVNPIPLLANCAEGGIDLEEIGSFVTTVGASYHPAWQFTFAQRHEFPALMAAGVSKQRLHRGVSRVEVTEVQTGNTLGSSHRPSDVSAREIFHFYLSGLAAGAEMVCGWCLNVRSQDNEAGDWGLLTDDDRPSVRSRAMRKLHDRLDRILAGTGLWIPEVPVFWIVCDQRSQALEWVCGKVMGAIPGREANEGAYSSVLLASDAMKLGAPVGVASLDDLPAEGAGQVAVVAHVLGWEQPQAERMLNFVQSGGTLILDGVSGRLDFDYCLHRTWPLGLGPALGFSGIELESDYTHYPATLHGYPLGQWVTSRARFCWDDAAGWIPWSEMRYTVDGAPCIHERRFGAGRVIVTNGLLGSSRRFSPQFAQTIDYLFRRALPQTPCVHNADPTQLATLLPFSTDAGRMVLVLSPESDHIRLVLEAGNYKDEWTGTEFTVLARTERELPLEEGVGLIRCLPSEPTKGV